MILFSHSVKLHNAICIFLPTTTTNVFTDSFVGGLHCLCKCTSQDWGKFLQPKVSAESCEELENLFRAMKLFAQKSFGGVSEDCRNKHHNEFSVEIPARRRQAENFSLPPPFSKCKKLLRMLLFAQYQPSSLRASSN